VLGEAVAIPGEFGTGLAASRARTFAARLACEEEARSPDGLTPREVEVAHLAAVGKADKEIAAKLFISSHTTNDEMPH
jgi:DNA-binding NarL/FixJ family response regulator